MDKNISLSPSLKEFFQSAFKEAMESTINDGKLPINSPEYRPPDILSVVEHLEELIDKKDTSSLSSEDRLVVNCFVPALRNTVKSRRMTMGITSFISKLTEFLMYICVWLNSERNFNIDMKLESRRKSLESELTKILWKSLENVYDRDRMGKFMAAFQPPLIRDRYGLRLILAEDNSEVLMNVTKTIIAILTNPVSQDFKEFYEWFSTTTIKYGGVEIPKSELLEICDYSFLLSNIKDYITESKPSSYMSWHATLTVDQVSPSLGGLMFEIQIRTWKMHVNAEIGKASHDKYKLDGLYGTKDVFKVGEDYSGGIVFYEGPQYPSLDKDGLTYAAPILSRHVSPHVIPH